MQVVDFRFHLVVHPVDFSIPASRYCNPVGPPEYPPIPEVLVDAIAAFVHETMMAGAKEQQVVETRLAAGRPVPNMVRIDEAAVSATGKRAAFVTRPQGTADGGRHNPGLAPDAKRSAVFVIDDSHPVRIAAEAPDRFHGQGGVACIVGERGVVDMDVD